MKSKSSKANILAVAETAGVSMATVSRVLNHNGIVKKETQLRVLEAAKALNYKPEQFNAIAGRSPVGNKLLIINIPSLMNPFYTEIISGAQSVAQMHGYDLLINQGNIDERSLSDYLQMLKRISVRGVIVTNPLSLNVLERINHSVPVVQCCEYIENNKFSYVGVDDLTAGKNAMKYILSTGRRKIAFINGPLKYKYAQQRQQAFLESMRDANLEVNPNWIIELPEVNADLAFSSVTKLLSQPERPDAILTISDILAAATIRAAHQNGFSVPRDMIVVGFDDTYISSITSPSITIVKLPCFQLGAISAEYLCECIDNPMAPVHQTILNTELIIRESSAIDSLIRP